MALPLYQAVHDDPPKLAGHRGLWYARFFDGFNSAWGVEGSEAKRDWINKSAEADKAAKPRDEAALTDAACRLIDLAEARGGTWFTVTTEWNFVTGLGLPHPVENGFLWHPTLGVPYLPGSSLKGLLRAFVEVWADGLDETQRRERIAAWFGTAAGMTLMSGDQKGDAPKDSRAGDLIVFDAIPIKPVDLTADVMTPHLDKWYEQGDAITNLARDADKIPADWHDPVPVPFLVVKKATLLVALAPRHPHAKAELLAARESLLAALADLGAGAKTAVGYGRFARNEGAEHALESDREKRHIATLSEPERLRRKHREALGLPPADQVEYLAKLSQAAIPSDYKGREADYKAQLRALFAGAVAWLNQQLQAPEPADAPTATSAAVERDEQQLAEHLKRKPADKRDKKYKKWSKERDKIQRRLESARHTAVKSTEDAKQHRGRLVRLRDWLNVPKEPSA